MTSISDIEILETYELELATGTSRIYSRVAKKLLNKHGGDYTQEEQRSLSTRCRRVMVKHLEQNEAKTPQQTTWSSSKIDIYIYLLIPMFF